MTDANADADDTAVKQKTGNDAGQNRLPLPHPSNADNNGADNNNADGYNADDTTGNDADDDADDDMLMTDTEADNTMQLTTTQRMMQPPIVPFIDIMSGIPRGGFNVIANKISNVH
jgi:hypothetical protein